VVSEKTRQVFNKNQEGPGHRERVPDEPLSVKLSRGVKTQHQRTGKGRNPYRKKKNKGWSRKKEGEDRIAFQGKVEGGETEKHACM